MPGKCDKRCSAAALSAESEVRTWIEESEGGILRTFTHTPSFDIPGHLAAVGR